MDILWNLIFLSLGLLLVIKGGDWFVDSSVSIARHFHVPRMVIGGTLVSIGTTLPELIVSATASFLGDSGIAIGNAVGSSIANIGLIVGVMAMMTHVTVDIKAFRRRSCWMVIAALLVVILCWDMYLSRSEGTVLLILGLAYLFFDYWSMRGSKKRGIGTTEVFEEGGQKEGIKKSWVFFLLGAVLVVVGSKFLVDSGSAIALALGIPSVLIGLSVIAIGTSLPELVTAVASARKNVPDLSIGNIVGANILDLALIAGVSGVIHPLNLTNETRLYSFPWMAVFILFMVGRFAICGNAGRKQGIMMLILYGLYMAGIILIPFYF